MHTRYTRPLLHCANITVKAAGSRKHTGTVRRCVQVVGSPHQPLSWSNQPRRTFTDTATMATSAHFSAGVDEPALTRALEPLLASAGRRRRWVLIPSGEGLERTFQFKTFAKTWDFMTAVSLQCKLKNHHPEWSNVYNTTYIRWTTHNPKGLSAKDVELAAICDDLAKDFGEIIEETGGVDSCELKQVADRVVSSAGDCCTPKK